MTVLTNRVAIADERSDHAPAQRLTSVEPASVLRRVRVWFGAQAICDYLGEPEDAKRYERAMSRRFIGLRVTNEAAAEADSRDRQDR